MNEHEIRIPAKPNLDISLGKDFIKISLTVDKTFVNRFRYWMLCQFFPFKIERWE